MDPKSVEGYYRAVGGHLRSKLSWGGSTAKEPIIYDYYNLDRKVQENYKRVIQVRHLMYWILFVKMSS